MANIPSGTQFHAQSPSVDTERLRSQLLNSLSDSYTIEDIAASVGGIGGTNYIYVMADGTDVENAAELQSAYTTAQGMSPSATNIITIVCPPGEYNFGSTAFTMSTQYINLVSLDGNRSVLFNSANVAGTISITANNVFVKGVDVGTKQFIVGNNLPNIVIDNCKGGDYSFVGHSVSPAANVICNGTYINCEGGSYCWGAWHILGTYGITSTASGTFINCKGVDYCFGVTNGGDAIASGTFTNCTVIDYSFGYEIFGTGNKSIASGVFRNCISNSYSFASYYGVGSGTFYECEGGAESFVGSGICSGTYYRCIGGNMSFANNFGVGLNTLSGKLYWCKKTAGTFRTVSGGGQTRMCLDGTNVENNQG